MRRRAGFLLGLAAAILLGAALRLGTRTQLTSGPRVRALTADDNYHLRRARFAVAHYPRTILFDPMMNFPQGGVSIWPPLFDVALATPARLLHGAAASPEAVERGAAWVPLFLAAGSIFLAGLLGRQIFGEDGIFAALFLAVCPGHILWTQYGHTDQHAAESFFGLLMLWLFLRSRERGTLASEISVGAALAAAVLAWQGAIYWGAIFALSLVLESARAKRSGLRAALAILGLSTLATAGASAFWLKGFRPPLTYISFGFFQPLFLAALAGGAIVLDTILLISTRPLTRQETIARIALACLAGLVVLPAAGPLLEGLARGLGYVVGETSGEIATSTGYVSYPKNWLKGIFEARPLLAEGPVLAARHLSLAFFLSPVAIALWIGRAWRRERTGLHIALAVWGCVTLSLALWQRLNVYYAAVLAGVTLVEVARSAARRLAETATARRLVAGAIGLALVSPFITATAAEVRALHVPGSDLYATLDWMRRELPHEVEPYDPRMLSPASLPPELTRASSVLAPWSLGHLILYESGLPVVANNFGYGFADSLQFFLAETEEEALAVARRRRARWVLATDLAPRMNDYASYLGRPPSLQITPQGLLPTQRYFQTLQSRLYDFDCAGSRTSSFSVPPLAHFRLRFHSASAIRRGGRWLARWKVFEILDELPSPNSSRTPGRNTGR